MSKRPAPADRVNVEAVFLKLMGSEVTPDDWDEHERRMRESAEYKRHFETCEAAWHDLDRISLPEADAGVAVRPQALPRHQATRWAAAAVVVLAVMAGFVGAGGLFDRKPEPVRYQTAIGELRTIELDDGSVLNIGARSRVTVRYTPDTRLIELERGQLLATVSHDPARPFVVATDDAMVMATGTAFDVHDSGPYSTISVVEGTVRVVALHTVSNDAAAGGGPVTPGQFDEGQLLERGQQLRASRGVVPGPVRVVNIDQVIGWRTGQIFFHETELGVVLDEVMRYTDVRLRLLDPDLAQRLYTGSFRPDSLSGWLDAISRAYSLRVTRHGEDWIAIAPRDEPVDK